MTETGVDGNFKRLEEEVNRLLEVLDQLRGENTTLRERITSLEATQRELETLRGRMTSVEEQNRQADARDGQVRDRLEKLLSRLDEAAI
jgi:chromosome segregation ATPase